jgi:hypothetical protein
LSPCESGGHQFIPAPTKVGVHGKGERRDAEIAMTMGPGLRRDGENGSYLNSASPRDQNHNPFPAPTQVGAQGKGKRRNAEVAITVGPGLRRDGEKMDSRFRGNEAGLIQCPPYHAPTRIESSTSSPHAIDM